MCSAEFFFGISALFLTMFGREYGGKERGLQVSQGSVCG